MIPSLKLNQAKAASIFGKTDIFPGNKRLVLVPNVRAPKEAAAESFQPKNDRLRGKKMDIQNARIPLITEQMSSSRPA